MVKNTAKNLEKSYFISAFKEYQNGTREHYIMKIIANGYSVREVEQIAKTFAEKPYKRTSKETKENAYTFQHKKIIYDLSKKFNIDVQIKINKNGSGKIIIPFNSNNDIELISKNLKK